jgi:hypothetical protein
MIFLFLGDLKNTLIYRDLDSSRGVSTSDQIAFPEVYPQLSVSTDFVAGR